MNTQSFISKAREAFHKELADTILSVDKKGVVSNADKDSASSVEIARGSAQKLGADRNEGRLAGQKAGNLFEAACTAFIKQTFPHVQHLRAGTYEITRVRGRNTLEIARFEQYAHLVALDEAAKQNAELAAALGSYYTITPDVIIARMPEEDEVLNSEEFLVDAQSALKTPLRKNNNLLPILHASISCKWTMRSDRAQNARSEALNLVRNRKGRLPHVVIVIGEPLPSRIASLALGTGDIDCVYHFALPELYAAVQELEKDDALESLNIRIEGRRLRDISDLPLDLAI
jgi:hypothetical protein